SLTATESPTTAIFPLSLHDALPILAEAVASGGGSGCLSFLRSASPSLFRRILQPALCVERGHAAGAGAGNGLPIDVILHVAGCRSEEHTSDLQSRENPACRLLPENK